MSEGTGTLRALYRAWNANDLELGITLMDPAVEFRTSGDYPGVAPVYRGHDGMRRFWDDFAGAWETISVREERFEELGDRVLALFHFVGHGREGVTVEREGGHLARVENGLLVWLVAYGSWATALEAARGGGADPRS